MKRLSTLLVLILTGLSLQAQSLSTLYKAALALSSAAKVYQAYNITDEDMAKYMSQTMKQMDTENNVCPASSPYTVRLKKITRGMTSVDGIKVNFKVYQDSETANAFASPDGSIRVYSKLMDLMTDDELLGILAHEMGHLAHRDSKNEYRAQLIAAAAREGLMLSDGTIGSLAASSLGDIGEVLLTTKYSRRQETAADDYGYNYLKKHGVNPWAMAKALEKLKNLQNDTSNKYVKSIATLLSTHPDLNTRIETMSRRAKADGYVRK